MNWLEWRGRCARARAATHTRPRALPGVYLPEAQVVARGVASSTVIGRGRGSEVESGLGRRRRRRGTRGGEVRAAFASTRRSRGSRGGARPVRASNPQAVPGSVGVGGDRRARAVAHVLGLGRARVREVRPRIIEPRAKSSASPPSHREQRRRSGSRGWREAERRRCRGTLSGGGSAGGVAPASKKRNPLQVRLARAPLAEQLQGEGLKLGGHHRTREHRDDRRGDQQAVGVIAHLLGRRSRMPT